MAICLKLLVEREAIDNGYSAWVLKNILKMSKMVEVTLEGMEKQLFDLFEEIERRRFEKKTFIYFERKEKAGRMLLQRVEEIEDFNKL